MAQIFLNNCYAKLAATLSASATTVELTDMHNFPESLADGDWFLLTIYLADSRYGSNFEVVKVTAIDGSTLTIERAYEGTAGIHRITELVESRVTAESLRNMLTDAAAYADDGLALKLNADQFTGINVLSLLKDVDADDSGLNANTLQGVDLTALRSEIQTVANAAAAGVVDAAPGTLDTLNELAAALGDDPNFATTMATQLGNKLDKSSYTAADVLAKLKTVDTDTAGINATTLKGKTLGDDATALAGGDVVPTAAQVLATIRQFGLGSIRAPVVSSLDDLTLASGLYRVEAGVTGNPSDRSGVLVHSSYTADSFGQLFLSLSNSGLNRTFQRTAASGVLGPWQEIFHSGNVATESEAKEGERDDVPMTPLKTLQTIQQFGPGRLDVPIQYPINDLSVNPVNVPAGKYIFGGNEYLDAPAGATMLLELDHYSVGTNNVSRVRVTPWYSSLQCFTYERLYKNDEAGPWKVVYGTDTIVGTVEDNSEGKPIGAIIESGENANGRYTKFADGTLICESERALTSDDSQWYSLSQTGLYYYRMPNWTFPHAFAKRPNVSLGNTHYTWYRSAGVLSKNDVRLDIVRESPSAYVDLPVMYYATGRWK